MVALLVVVLCTLGGMVVEGVTFSISMWVNMPDPFLAEWCVALASFTFLQVNASKHRLACYGMLVELIMVLDQGTWHG